MQLIPLKHLLFEIRVSPDFSNTESPTFKISLYCHRQRRPSEWAGSVMLVYKVTCRACFEPRQDFRRQVIFTIGEGTEVSEVREQAKYFGAFHA